MPFQSRRAALELSAEARTTLDMISRSRSEPIHRVERAKIMLSYASGSMVSAIARALQGRGPSQPGEAGPRHRLEDSQRPGDPPAQDYLLPRAGRSGVRAENGAATASLQAGRDSARPGRAQGRAFDGVYLP